MSFLKKILNLSSKTTKEKVAKNQEVSLTLEDSFVHNFIERGGKFLYCIKKDEVISNFQKIIKENNWKEIICVDESLTNYIKDVDITVKTDLNSRSPLLTLCECLIADDGSILFSSNQLKEVKKSSLSECFVVYASISQIVKSKRQALEEININYRFKEIPTNISSVKNYTIDKNKDNLSNYGNGNLKNLYLLLFEDL